MKNIFITQNSFYFVYKNFIDIFNSGSNTVIFVKETRRGIIKKYIEIYKYFKLSNLIKLIIKEFYYRLFFLFKKVTFKKVFINDYNLNNTIKKILDQNNYDLIVSVGCPCKIDSNFIHKYKIRILNLHGGILPFQRGRFSPMKALSLDHQFLGATLHTISYEYDKGNIISQKVFRVRNKNILTNYDRVIRISSVILKFFFKKRLFTTSKKILFQLKNQYP